MKWEDHSEPTALEIESSKVIALLQELQTGILPSYYGTGFYLKKLANSDKNFINSNKEKLNKEIQKIEDIKEFSIEMQTWYLENIS